MTAQLSQRLVLDPLDQMAQDIVEHLDLVIVQTIPGMQEKIRDLPQGADAFGRRAASDGFLKLGDDGNRLLHNSAQSLVQADRATPATLS